MSGTVQTFLTFTKSSRSRAITSRNPPQRSRPLTLPSIVAAIFWAGWLAIVLTLFVQASEAAKTAPDGATIAKTLLGAPDLSGFHEGGNFGVHLEWGMLLLLLIPLFCGLAVAALSLGARRRQHAEAS